MKRILLIIGTLFSLATGAHALDISDYTAYPPFLPRVTSPNILFLLDYSKSMVRPAYGTCNKYGSNATTPSSYANCGSVLSGDRVFNHMTDDYSSTTAYYGYYDNGYGRTDITGCNASGTYTDSCAFKYACSAGSYCSKDSGGSWNGNWLNWLTMTQFDVMKKVVIGGDTDPAPDNQAASSPNIKSKLTSLDDAGTSLIGGIYKAITFSNYSGRAPRAEWSANTPQTLPYSWIDSTESGVTNVTTVFGAPTDSVNVLGSDWTIRTATLPFDMKIYGNDYPVADTQLQIYTNGLIYFYNSATWIDGWFLPYYVWSPYLNIEISKNSTIKTFTKGTAPNRIFVISYENMISSADAGKANPLTFQVLISEDSQVIFQYKQVQSAQTYGGGKDAWVSVYNYDGTEKRYSYFPASATLSDSQALFMTPKSMLYQVKPQTNDETIFQPAPPLACSGGACGTANDYNVEIDVTSVAKPAGGCVNGWYSNSTANNKNKCYDHEITGLFQDLADGELGGTLGFRLGVMRVGYNGDDGGDIKTVGKEINVTAPAAFFTATRGNGPTDKTPLGEAMYEATRFFIQTSPKWPSTGTADYNYDDATDLATCSTTGNEYDPYCFQSAGQKVSCCKSFVLLLSSGNYSDDFGLNIYDTTSTGETAAPEDIGSIKGCKSTLDNTDTCTGDDEGLKANGGWLDDVAYRAHVADLRTETGMEATQNMSLYVVNTFGEAGGDGTNFLKRAAKYGGFDDSDGDSTYDSGEDDKDSNSVPDTYFEASGGSDLKSKIIDAITEIMRSSASGTSVSVLSTSAGGEGAIYQAYFYPAKLEGDTEERTWPGFMKSFFLDKKQNLRDDSSGGTYTCDSTEGTCTNNASPDAALVATEDKIAQMCLNTTTNEVKVKLYADAGGDYIADTANDGSCPAVTSSGDPKVVGMDDVVSIWEAGKKLALRDKSTRNIYAWVDTDHNGVVDNGDFSSLSGEALAFTTANASTLKPYLRAADPDPTTDPDGACSLTAADQPRTADGEAANIISFIRGNEVDSLATPGTLTILSEPACTTGTTREYRYKYRNRCVTISGATTETGCSESNQRVWGLGDIINSTPTLVSGPGEQYDQIYNDASTDTRYGSFRTKYQNRRRMVYVGANDGMLHAFNAGIFNESTTSFDDNPSSGNGWGSSTIGDELWAFVPYDNLPHLQWLACNGTESDPSQCGSSEYTHVFYVDARPKVTDARIFCRNASADAAYSSSNYPSSCITGQGDASHPNGWGTIMIMSMRFGGGAIDVTADFGSGSATKQFRSAYYAFDVTDPEKKPRLLWRFTNADLGFTTSYPAIARMGAKNETGKWYMVVGNGPKNAFLTGLNSGDPPERDYGGKSTSLTGKVFVVDLVDGSLDKTFTLDSNTYMGDPLVVDENFDFSSDVIYIGSSIGTGTDDVGGKVYRIRTNGRIPSGADESCPNPVTSTNNWCRSVLINAGEPMLTSPSVATDLDRKLWVFFGTGRLRNSGSPSDLTNFRQQKFYGIKDDCGKAVNFDATPVTGSTCSDEYSEAQLANVGSSKVTLSSTTVTDVSAPTSCTSGCTIPTDYNQFVTKMKDFRGWFVNLGYDGTAASERVLSRPAVLGGIVLFTTYKPAASICSIFGDSKLYALNYQTGTAYSKAIVGSTSSSTGIGTSASTTGTYVSKGIELGKGMPTAVGIAVGEKVTGFVQKSTGEIIRIESEPGTSIKSGAASWREKTGGGGTSEIETIYKHIVK